MKLEIIVVRDRTANCFGQPQFVPSLGAAIRSFADEINREANDNMLYKHPEDYDLYHLGWYGDGDAHMELKKPEQIAVGANLKR